MTATAAQITVDGAPLPADCAALLELTVVEDHVMLPASFELHFRDPGTAVLQRAGLRISADVSIVVAGSAGPQELVRGDVLALEVTHDTQGTHTVARGFDRAHRFTRGARAETYRDVTDADVVRTLAGRASVPLGHVEDPGIVHPTLAQVGVSDWAFLSARAHELGYALAIRDGKLDFAPPTAASEAPAAGEYGTSNPLQLVLGQNLESCRLTVSAAAQVASVEVRGWDPARRAAVVAEARAGTAAVAAGTDPGRLAGVVGAPGHAHVRASFATQAEVDAAAAAVAEDIGARALEGDGVAFGDPALRAGQAVSISHVGQDFEGSFLLTATRHRLDARGYRTHLTISGRRDTSLPGLVRGAAAERPTMPQLATGIVSDVDDPDGQGRVKAHLAWLGDDIETDWLRVTQLLAGSGHGAAFPPEVGDEVLIAFERADARRGFVLGALFNGVDRAQVDGPPVSGGRVVRRGWASPGGHTLILHEAGGPVSVELVSAGDLTMRATGRLSLSAQQGIEIDAGPGPVDVKGLTINLG